jgi:hypothetical protein
VDTSLISLGFEAFLKALQLIFTFFCNEWGLLKMLGSLLFDIASDSDLVQGLVNSSF